MRPQGRPAPLSPADADVVIHPERDVTAEVARGEDAEKAAGESRSPGMTCGTAARRGVSALNWLRLPPVNWKKVLKRSPIGGIPGIDPGQTDLRESLLLRFRAQHHGRDLQDDPRHPWEI